MPEDRTPKTLEEWKEGMKKLASNPNVVVKISSTNLIKIIAICFDTEYISGLGMTDHHWTVDSLRPYVLGTIESTSHLPPSNPRLMLLVFGVDRCMFGSNFPIDKLLSDFNKLFNAFQEIVRDFSVQDQQKLFHDNGNSPLIHCQSYSNFFYLLLSFSPFPASKYYRI
jgi:Amidohydrolase